MKMRNKGKVHPFSSSSSPSCKDSFSVLKLLPATILALLTALSSDDRQVLAYMLTRSLKSDDKNLTNAATAAKNPQCCGDAAPNSAAMFDCDCFRCYTSFWLRWDSSPNRELIHQAIEAFEDHLSNGNDFKKNKTSRRKEKIGRRKTEKVNSAGAGGFLDFPSLASEEEVAPEAPGVPEEADEDVEEPESVTEDKSPDDAAAAGPPAACGHKALARKVLPDVMGIFNSRLWSLWSPNV